MTQVLKYNDFKSNFQYVRTVVPVKPESVSHCSTVIVTSNSLEYTTFLKILQKRNLFDTSHSLIEMQHRKHRMSYVKLLDLLVIQQEDMPELEYLNIHPDRILLTGTARCFDVKQAPCDTIVTADIVWDKEQDILYKCPCIDNMLISRIYPGRLRTGGYFSGTDVQTILQMQEETNRKYSLLAFDGECVTFARICNTLKWKWSIIKTVTNDLNIPNYRMREHAAVLAANYIIELLTL